MRICENFIHLPSTVYGHNLFCKNCPLKNLGTFFRVSSDNRLPDTFAKSGSIKAFYFSGGYSCGYEMELKVFQEFLCETKFLRPLNKCGQVK